MSGLKTKTVVIQPKIVVVEEKDKEGKVTGTKEVEVENRDVGKTYQIKEMNVLDIDNWSNRVLSNMAGGGLSLTNLDFSGGFDTSSLGGILQLAQLAIQGFGNIAPHISQELLDELVDKTVQFETSGGSLRKIDTSAGDLQEVSTLWLLRKEAFLLHVGSFTLGVS